MLCFLETQNRMTFSEGAFIVVQTELQTFLRIGNFCLSILHCESSSKLVLSQRLSVCGFQQLNIRVIVDTLHFVTPTPGWCFDMKKSFQFGKNWAGGSRQKLFPYLSALTSVWWAGALTNKMLRGQDEKSSWVSVYSVQCTRSWVGEKLEVFTLRVCIYWYTIGKKDWTILNIHTRDSLSPMRTD